MLKTSCPHGHPYDEINTLIRIRKGKEVKECRACNRERVNKWRGERIAYCRTKRKESDALYYQNHKVKIEARRKARKQSAK